MAISAVQPSNAVIPVQSQIVANPSSRAASSPAAVAVRDTVKISPAAQALQSAAGGDRGHDGDSK